MTPTHCRSLHSPSCARSTYSLYTFTYLPHPSSSHSNSFHPHLLSIDIFPHNFIEHLLLSLLHLLILPYCFLSFTLIVFIFLTLSYPSCPAGVTKYLLCSKTAILVSHLAHSNFPRFHSLFQLRFLSCKLLGNTMGVDAMYKAPMPVPCKK